MKAKLFVHSKYQIGEVDRKLFGGFVEHIGRSVYTGIYEPGHPTADANGFRGDVAELVRELDMPITRYPGGNFVSGFDWKDAIGPREKRPVRPDYAWKAMETNEFGLDEFMKWCAAVNTEPMYAVNLGTNTAKSAQELVEYCNFPGGTSWSEQRRSNGADKPYGIKYWCLGNEMDGDWQIGHKTSSEYGRIAHETAKMMKLVDPSIKLCVCGSSNRCISTYGSWDFDVVKEAFKYVDFLSIHNYFSNLDHNIPNFLAGPEIIERQILDAIAICDAVAAVYHSDRRLMVALDEWNVAYRCSSKVAPETEWKTVRPIVEENYDMADVLVIGGTLMELMKHADRVKIANLAQTVNVIAPIMTEPGGRAWRQTIFHPFALMSKYGRGVSMQLNVDSPSYQGTGEYKGQITYLKSAVIHNQAADEIVVFALNRSMEEEIELEAEFGGFQLLEVIDATEIHHDNPDATNTAEAQNVQPAVIDSTRYRLTDGKLVVSLKPFSWNMLRIKVK